MANFITYKETKFKIGDMISIDYLVKEGEKNRHQIFRGILMQVKGDSLETKMITVRKMTRSGIGVERIIPLNSPFIAKITLVKKGTVHRAKIGYIRDLSDQDLRRKLYPQ
jgi:large subunit ribosomal protein L19